jgi:type III restriction enzyme
VSFASWRKCDFQVHSPRDPNWTGNRPIGLGELVKQSGTAAKAQDVDAARAAWATKFVDQCAAKGLRAVALTDHHEMIMVPYVQKAIEDRRKADAKFDLWFFPGMELTAGGGKQCLIIFDADLSEEWRKQAQGKLGIVYADLNEKTATAPKVAQLTSNYADIAKSLDEIEGLQGKYIVLPNVSQGQKHTVLTDGAHGDFRRMPYVGGYLDRDQTIDTLGTRNLRRLSGTDKTWSVREIYPLPTSDSRSEDFAALGQNNAWIKLAEPTAEAIRQAFLGHRSRIRIKQPQIPSLFITSAEVDNSAILQPTALLLSPELNAVIGGRGSGKSSFLEYVAFALGRSCYDIARDHYSVTQRMHDLINDTLVSKGGRVSLNITQDNATFQIVRGPATAHQPQITYPSGTTQTITVKELCSLFPAVVYSQGELAEIGNQAGKKAQLSELLQFVNPEYKREDDELASDIEAAKRAVGSAIQAIAANWELQSKLRKQTTSADSLRQRVEALEKTLPTLSPDDQAIVDFFDNANDFDSKRTQASKHADQMLQQIQKSVAELLIERDLSSELKRDVEVVQHRYHSLFTAFESGAKQLQADLAAKREALTAAETDWAVKFTQARVARDGVLQKLGDHRTVTAQIIKLREEITNINNQIGDIEAQLKAQGDPSTALNVALDELRRTNDRRDERTRIWATEIQRMSSGKIRAVVAVIGDTSEIMDAVDAIAAKTGSQEATRIKELETALEHDSATNVIDRLRTDCLALLHWRLLGAGSGEDQPKCADLRKIIGDTDRIRAAVTERMEVTRATAIATAVSRPEISLTYCDGTREISFEKASEGQRAAALLFLLLEQPGGPLIIDQPEGDLDNKIIADLTNKLHDAKQARQLIFASHNANIVVNGSSELVGYLDVRDSGERQFECAGAIDKSEICNIITSTMEGGEKAFKDRQDKYGY